MDRHISLISLFVSSSVIVLYTWTVRGYFCSKISCCEDIYILVTHRQHSGIMWENLLTDIRQHKEQQECIPIGCVPSAAVAVRGVCFQGGCFKGGFLPSGCLPWVCLPRGCLSGGCLPGGVCPVCTGKTPPPTWTEWLTDRCKNITFPQFRLQTIIRNNKNAFQ